MRISPRSAALEFSGSRFEAMLLLAAVVGVFVIGGTAITMGVWQIARGTRNRTLVRLAAYLYLMFLLAYGIVSLI